MGGPAQGEAARRRPAPPTLCAWGFPKYNHWSLALEVGGWPLVPHQAPENPSEQPPRIPQNPTWREKGPALPPPSHPVNPRPRSTQRIHPVQNASKAAAFGPALRPGTFGGQGLPCTAAVTAHSLRGAPHSSLHPLVITHILRLSQVWPHLVLCCLAPASSQQRLKPGDREPRERASSVRSGCVWAAHPVHCGPCQQQTEGCPPISGASQSGCS